MCICSAVLCAYVLGKTMCVYLLGGTLCVYVLSSTLRVVARRYSACMCSAAELCAYVLGGTLCAYMFSAKLCDMCSRWNSVCIYSVAAGAGTSEPAPAQVSRMLFDWPCRSSHPQGRPPGQPNTLGFLLDFADKKSLRALLTCYGRCKCVAGHLMLIT